MAADRTWTVEVDLVDADGGTTANAYLRTDAEVTVRGTGRSWRIPPDCAAPGLADELAAARALTELGWKLLRRASDTLVASGRSRVG